MADDAGRITWHDPDPRAVFDLERLTIPSRLARYVRANGFAFRQRTDLFQQQHDDEGNDGHGE